MSDHHEFGPSCLRRRELCPGSVYEERDLPDISNPASERGTRLHNLIAESIKAGFVQKCDSEEDFHIVVDMYEYFELVSGHDANLKYAPELRLFFGDDKGVLFFGTCDVLIINEQEKRGVIIDWKTGFKEVDSAEDNIQGLGYAVCAMQMYNLESVTVVFYNPVIHQKTEYTFERNLSLFNHVQQVISDSKNGKGNLKPGEEQCMYCKAALHGTCPAFRGIATELYEVAKRQPLEMISTMPDSTLVDVVEKGKLISKLADAAEKELKDRCEKSGEVCGYFLKEVSGGREADDLKGLWGMLKPELNQEDFLSCCKVSIPSLEKQFIKATGSPVKEGKERFADLTADYITEKPARKMLAKVKGEK
jgi:hypothetical protein